VFADRVLRTVLRLHSDEVRGGWRKLQNMELVICKFILNVTALTRSIHGELDIKDMLNILGTRGMYRGADKPLPRPGRKQANVSVRLA